MTDTPTAELVAYLRSRPLDRRAMEAAERLERLEAECAKLRRICDEWRDINLAMMNARIVPDEALGE